MADILDDMSAVNDGNDVPGKNILLRRAHSEIVQLRTELARFRSEREYIIGCNDGFETAIEQAALVAGDYAGKQSPIAAAIRALHTPMNAKGQADV